ncbi:aminotransferase class I/II-fold pyridoxal phosphate-dependent enzyme [Lentisphaera profundi]|uniref:Aminotransferase class I/II-fold pyridoxal phosphate-dependent enzyme n=1 Tax=Lentisphaera profundi TaxID=1658616 RepID=A0ABY7VX28_9BACT|nr:aminotransferase class I/II-fold pyridoxal phosphate-dependent enzyme [Lentisphaera profundi]WDE98778.1 aminotransferase class I/II-fold pyridoxal phosphate-dependent enzyme [Lentisphaera profundi]
MKYNSYLSSKNEYSLSKYHNLANKLRDEGHQVINLTIGDPVERTYPEAYLALEESLKNRRISQYPSFKGKVSLRQSIADWAKRNHDIVLDSNTQICSTNGSKEAVFHLALLFDWSEGQEIWAPSLSYPVYASSAGLFDIPYRELPVSRETNFLPDLDTIAEEDWHKCQMFWINSPHNPTSAIASKAYLAKLLALAEKHDFLVCADECYNDIFYGELPTSILDFPESQHWLCIRSLSKRSHMTGFRSGALLSPNTELMKKILLMRPALGVGTPDFIQDAAIAAWEDDQHPKVFSEEYKVKQKIIREALNAKGFDIFGGDASFYLWFSHPKFNTSEELMQIFIEQHLVLTPGTAFGQDGEGFIRMVYCSTLDQCEEIAHRINSLNI